MLTQMEATAGGQHRRSASLHTSPADHQPAHSVSTESWDDVWRRPRRESARGSYASPADGPMGALTRPDTRRDLVGVLLYDIMPTVAWEPPVCI